MPSSHVVVFQYETRKENYLLALMKKNQEFCVNHGYRYYCMSHAVPFPAYWVKVWIGLDLMITMNEGDILMWLDSDAVFVNPSTRIESLFDHLSPSTVFLASADPHPWPSIFNAGVFAIKVTPQSLLLMQDWLNCYNPSRWAKTLQNAWIAKGVWAGDDYEQGAFVRWIVPKHRKRIHLCPPDVFCCVESRDFPSEAITSHFCGSHKKRIKDFLLQNPQVDEDWKNLEIETPNTDNIQQKSLRWLLLLLPLFIIPLFIVFTRRSRDLETEQFPARCTRKRMTIPTRRIR